jgi:hypothetical protein
VDVTGGLVTVLVNGGEVTVLVTAGCVTTLVAMIVDVITAVVKYSVLVVVPTVCVTVFAAPKEHPDAIKSTAHKIANISLFILLL